MKKVPRRRSPRSMEDVLAGVMAEIAPSDPLSKLQAAWPQVAGTRDAAYSEPRRQLGDGTIVIRCESAALAAELSMRERQLVALAEELTELQVRLKFEGPRGRRQRDRGPPPATSQRICRALTALSPERPAWGLDPRRMAPGAANAVSAARLQ